MNRTFKGFYGLLIVGVLSLALMAGCGSDGGSSDPVTVSSEEPAIDSTLGSDIGTPLYMGSSQFSPPSQTPMLKAVQSQAIETSNLLQGVPWVSQFPPGNIYTSCNCGPTSFLMTEAFYYERAPSQSDTQSTLKEFVKWLDDNSTDYNPPCISGEYETGDATGPALLKILAEHRGFRAEEIWGNSPDYLVTEIQKRHPVLVRIHYQPDSNIGKTEMQENYYKNGKSKGHYVVLVGINNDWVYINDPSRSWEQGAAIGAYQKYSRSSFEKVWSKGPGGNSNVGMVFYRKNENLPVTISVKSASKIAQAHASVGQYYSATLAAVYGAPPYSWSVIDGVLPSGLSLFQDGEIAGTPTSIGSFRFTVRVQDSIQAVTDAPVSLVVEGTAGSTGSLEITPNSQLLTGRLLEQYQFKLTAAGDSGPFNWSVISGSLPTGLSLSSDGRISGIPTVLGIYQFSVEVRNTVNRTSRKDFEITVLNSNANPVIYSLKIKGTVLFK